MAGQATFCFQKEKFHVGDFAVNVREEKSIHFCQLKHALKSLSKIKISILLGKLLIVQKYEHNCGLSL